MVDCTVLPLALLRRYPVGIVYHIDVCYAERECSRRIRLNFKRNLQIDPVQQAYLRLLRHKDSSL